MKIFYLPLTFLVALLAPFAVQSQQFIWAKKSDVSVRSLPDAQGNSVVTGTFGQSATFDDWTITDINPITPGESNIFWGKYSPSGILQYMFTNQGSGSISIIDAELDAQGNLYMAGAFSNVVSIDTALLIGDNGVYSYFIAKMNPAGQLTWIKTLNNDFDLYNDHKVIISKIACDREDNLVIAGTAEDYLMDGIQLGSPNSRRFFARLDATSGATLWVRKIFSQYQSHVNIMDFAFDPSNNMYLTGEFLTDCNFEGGNSITKAATSLNDAYVCKYDENGMFQWISQINGDPFVETVGLNFSGKERVSYVAGNQIRNYDTNGVLQWQKMFVPAVGYMYLTNIAKDKNADYLSATFTDQFIYDSTSLTNDGSVRSILFKTNPADGAMLWHTEPTGFTVSDHLNSNQKGLLQFSGKGFDKLAFGIHQLLAPVPEGELGFHTLIRDTAMNAGTNRIYGRVYNDTTADCLLGSEPRLNGFTVVAEPGPYFAISDSDGNYVLQVDTGTYYVSQPSPNSHAYIDADLCSADSLPVVFAGTGLASYGNDFGKEYRQCTLLRLGAGPVSLTVGATKAEYEMVVCNDGLDTSENTVLSLKYPGGVTVPMLSDPPFSAFNPADSTLTIPLQNIAPNSCMTISITDSLIQGSIQHSRPYPYAVSVTPANTCYLSDSLYTQKNFELRINVPVNIEQHGQVAKASVFPNPTTGLIMIKGAGAATAVKVYDIMGREIIHTINRKGDMISVDITAAPGGLYILQLVNKAQTQACKFIKQ